MEIKELLQDKSIEEYMERFKVYYPQSLFPLDWDLLKRLRCPICGLKLKTPLNNKVAYCQGKKHKKKFIIRTDTLKKLV